LNIYGEKLMNYDAQSTVARSQDSILATNKVLRNTYALLSMTLMFSALMAFVSITMQLSQMQGLLASIAGMVMLWLVLPRTANSATGIPVIFAITGLFGLGLGPIVGFYLNVNPSIVMTALGGTAVIFLALSAYTLTTRKDFSFMGGFLMVGMFVVIAASLANIFLAMPALSLASSAVVVLIMSGFILHETSAIIHGGETNYINATASLFLTILNLFTSLLQLLGAFSDD
jgi:modulator of FtsH protease